MHTYLPEASLWCDSPSELADPATRSESSSWSFSWDWESKREKNRLINTSKVYKSVLWSCMDFNQVQREIHWGDMTSYTNILFDQCQLVLDLTAAWLHVWLPGCGCV